MSTPRTLALIGCALLLVGTCAVIPLTLYRPLGANITARADHQCEGTEEFTCAPDSLVSAFSWVGKTVTEREMVIACGTTRNGTTADAVAKVAHSVVQNTLPESAPGRTFLVCIPHEYPKMHMVCAHGELDGWTVNDPAVHDPEHWTSKDFSIAVGAIEVK